MIKDKLPSLNIPLNPKRRKLLKFAGLGIVALAIGKVIDDKFYFGQEIKDGSIGQDFKIYEKRGQLSFFNKKGERLFVLGKDGEMEIGD